MYKINPNVTRKQDLYKILKRLGEYYSLPAERAVVWLKDENNKNFRDIGEICGFSHQQARNYYNRQKKGGETKRGQ